MSACSLLGRFALVRNRILNDAKFDAPAGNATVWFVHAVAFTVATAAQAAPFHHSIVMYSLASSPAVRAAMLNVIER